MQAKFVHKILEGVGDKYAEEKWGITDSDKKFEDEYRKFRLRKFGNVVGETMGYPIVKNPETLDLFPPGSRGLVMKNGDLMLVPDAHNVIHPDIIEALNKEGILTGANLFRWENVPEYPPNQFISVQRVWNKDGFGISESYTIPKRKHAEERADVMSMFEPFINAANGKNRQYAFLNDNVFTLMKNMLSPKEKEHFKRWG